MELAFLQPHNHLQRQTDKQKGARHCLAILCHGSTMLMDLFKSTLSHIILHFRQLNNIRVKTHGGAHQLNFHWLIYLSELNVWNFKIRISSIEMIITYYISSCAVLNKVWLIDGVCIPFLFLKRFIANRCRIFLLMRMLQDFLMKNVMETWLKWEDIPTLQWEAPFGRVGSSPAHWRPGSRQGKKRGWEREREIERGREIEGWREKES